MPLAYFGGVYPQFIHNLPTKIKKKYLQKKERSYSGAFMGRYEHLAKFWFKKGHSGNPAGPKPDRIREACKELLAMNGAKFIAPLTANEVRSFCQMLLSLPTCLIEELDSNPKTPGGVRSLARGLLRDMQQGKTSTVLTLMDRAFGPINRKTEVTLRNRYDPDDGKSTEELQSNLLRMAKLIVESGFEETPKPDNENRG